MKNGFVSCACGVLSPRSKANALIHDGSEMMRLPSWQSAVSVYHSVLTVKKIFLLYLLLFDKGEGFFEGGSTDTFGK